MLAALVATRRSLPAAIDIRFGFDPIGADGAGRQPAALARPAADSSREDLRSRRPRLPRAVRARRTPRVIHNAGGSEAQELAYALAVAVAYLRALEAGGIALDGARGMIYFRLAADADQFLTIAKFRALRKLWARVEEACGLAPEPAFVAAETAWRMMTRRDPWVNMLRETIAVFSAGLGGADAIAVLPFTAGARPARPASRAGSRATRSSCCWRNPTSRRSPIRPPAPAGSRT